MNTQGRRTENWELFSVTTQMSFPIAIIHNRNVHVKGIVAIWEPTNCFYSLTLSCIFWYTICDWFSLQFPFFHIFFNNIKALNRLMFILIRRKFSNLFSGWKQKYIISGEINSNVSWTENKVEIFNYDKNTEQKRFRNKKQ